MKKKILVTIMAVSVSLLAFSSYKMNIDTNSNSIQNLQSLLELNSAEAEPCNDCQYFMKTKSCWCLKLEFRNGYTFEVKTGGVKTLCERGTGSCTPAGCEC